MNVETTILSNLVYNEDYARRVVAFLNPDYFHSVSEKLVFEIIIKHYAKYNATPSPTSLKITLDDTDNVSSHVYQEAERLIHDLDDTPQEEQWLFDTTEKFCKDKAVYNAIMSSIEIIDGSDEKKSANAIPEMLQDALAVSFDNHIGHDLLEDFSDRFDFYHRVEERIPFDLEPLNKITKGGIPNKTLNILMAGTGVGKTLAMCHFASANMMSGKNVLYITMEMAEERIAERIDANILDTNLDDLKDIPKQYFAKKMKKFQSTCKGKLIVKEYPTAGAHAGHFRALIKELALKKNFKPDVIFIDYLNICASQRLIGSSNVNSYTYVKAIAEELRGLAVETNVPIWSATQTTRSGFGNSDVGLEDTSESFGLPATADLFLALIQTDELAELGQVMVKQLKNRYGDINVNKRFVLGIDKPKMKLYEVEEDAQTLIPGGLKPTEPEKESVFQQKFERKKKFEDFKV